jgi:hypothetical protein
VAGVGRLRRDGALPRAGFQGLLDPALKTEPSSLPRKIIA